jgi:hypothetical protein
MPLPPWLISCREPLSKRLKLAIKSSIKET